ncbi:uncharacterized protein VP01_441g2 [Puccinia sorghi]|uniref:Uncharacterized protein n=1 Tax=Puccinia sorghi TaxID=27349 RepID=A0A0L6UPK3_9BASI|nr:uncharacterized protein VP01_441g2 [Puccinia sorghi]
MKDSLGNRHRSDNKNISDSKVLHSTKAVVDGAEEKTPFTQSNRQTISLCRHQKNRTDRLEVHINGTVPSSVNTSEITDKIIKVLEESMQGRNSSDVDVAHNNSSRDGPTGAPNHAPPVAAAGQANLSIAVQPPNTRVIDSSGGQAVLPISNATQNTSSPTSKLEHDGSPLGNRNDTVHVNSALPTPTPPKEQNDSGNINETIVSVDIDDTRLQQNSSIELTDMPPVILPPPPEPGKPQPEPAESDDVYSKPFGVMMLPKPHQQESRVPRTVIILPHVTGAGNGTDTTRSLSSPRPPDPSLTYKAGLDGPPASPQNHSRNHSALLESSASSPHAELAPTHDHPPVESPVVMTGANASDAQPLPPAPPPQTPIPPVPENKVGKIKIILPDHTELSNSSASQTLSPTNILLHATGLGIGVMVIFEFI